ncbi:AMP-binding protein [Saccharopolyspora shandongensis]|uniref:AMP-binding protein n=1 Tax=Saccharopolyspora shandongensis TaxID=418495 RepID=UPI003431F138
MLNLAIVLEDSARSVPGRVAVVSGEQRLTYRQLDAAANRVAHLLASRGIVKGDKVALSCPNIAWFPVVYYGILKSGAVVVPLNVLLKRREIAYHLADSDARAYFCFEGGAELPFGREGRSAFDDTDGCEHFFQCVTHEPRQVFDARELPHPQNLLKRLPRVPLDTSSAASDCRRTADDRETLPAPVDKQSQVGNDRPVLKGPQCPHQLPHGQPPQQKHACQQPAEPAN